MPTVSWLQQEFSYGYDSGNILSLISGGSGGQRRKEAGDRTAAYSRKRFSPTSVPMPRYWSWDQEKVHGLGPSSDTSLKASCTPSISKTSRNGCSRKTIRAG